MASLLTRLHALQAVLAALLALSGPKLWAAPPSSVYVYDTSTSQWETQSLIYLADFLTATTTYETQITTATYDAMTNPNDGVYPCALCGKWERVYASYRP